MSQPTQNERSSPLSLQRLTAAFAQMLGSPSEPDGAEQVGPSPDPCEVNPRAIIEAILFVGAEEGRPRTADELAATMRDVTADEVRHAIAQLNEEYQRDASPYTIADRAEGFRMQLREDLARVRDKFYGRVKEVRLSPKALEVLSVVAYRQPTTAPAIDKLRGVSSGALLTQLVRRGLVRRERAGEEGGESRYFTTERFLQFFRIDSLDQLPRAAELDD